MTDSSEATVSTHYTHGGLVAAIETAIADAGKTPQTVTVDDLAPLDEFHIGGREASAAFLDQLGLTDAHHLLDIGCGLGGASRFAASRYGVRVTGIDLTAEFVETGKELCRWCGLHSAVSLHQGSALAMPFDDGRFDGAFMMHVGMNIADKHGLFREAFRVLRPGAVFGIFDIMTIGVGDLAFPVPWAASPAQSHVAPPETYCNALKSAGFALETERNRHDFAVDYFKRMQEKVAAAGGPPPLGLHVLMGESTQVKLANIVENLAARKIAPVELIARKPK